MTIETSFYPWLTTILVLLSIFMLYRGWKRGLIISLLDMISGIVSLLFGWGTAWLLAQLFPISSWIPGYQQLSIWQMEIVNQIFWFAVSFIAIRIVFMLLYKSAKWIRKIRIVALADHIFGLIFSSVFVFICLAVLSLFLQLPIIKGGQQYVQSSFLNNIAHIADVLCSRAMNGELNLSEIDQIVFKRDDSNPEQ